MDDVFHDSRLWPVRLVLPRRTGWSLWGGDTPDGHDFLLPAGSGFALFDTAGALVRHLRYDRSAHVLSRTSGWPHLIRGLTARTPEASEVADFRFDRLARWGPRSSGDGIIDCLDLIRDLGHQFSDPLLVRLSRPAGLLRHLYDVQWGDAEVLVEPQRVTRAVKLAVRQVAVLATWNPGTLRPVRR